MKAADIRCSNDLKMFENLMGSQDVIKANEYLKRQSGDAGSPIRRHLLSRSVRLTKAMSPSMHAMAENCISKLGVSMPLELFVYSSPQFNAACFKPEDNKLYVMFSSSLLEGFSESELMFVMGHELGHHVYGHHDIPIGIMLKGENRPSAKQALELFAWSRYAEISADRAGAHCAQDPNAVASALFKLASGLTGDFVEFDLDDFVKQVDEMMVVDQNAAISEAESQDWFSTHPFSPMRVKALQLFEASKLSTRGSMDVNELEVKVQALMSLMEPSYLQAKTDEAEAMRRFLFSAAIAVANASSGINKKEIEAFEEFFGKGSLSDKLNIEETIDRMQSRGEAVKEVASMARRMQLQRHQRYWVSQTSFIYQF